MAAHGEASTQPVIVRGSLITLKRKCGKPNCRCADGEPHETPALSYSLDGRTKMVTLRKEDIPKVKTALRAYQRAAKQLEQEAIKGIGQLRREIRMDRARGEAR
jgi:hypothetical protein|tara:strand:- start:1360 stop:1671 length:312 start_codon:yes stop_codon:yes gene_type:complete